jgi:hypothetical protein
MIEDGDQRASIWPGLEKRRSKRIEPKTGVGRHEDETRSADEFRRLGRSTRTYAIEPPTGEPP